MVTHAELLAWWNDLVAAWQPGLARDLRGIGTFQVNRLRTAIVSRERFRIAVDALDGQRPTMVRNVEAMMQFHAAMHGAAGPVAAGQEAAERLVADHVEESRRQVLPLLDQWPGLSGATERLERIVEKRPLRAERIAEGLARSLREGGE